ncbi:MAG: HEAT repeat domain-containing protein [Planctomycetia bacterium]
MPDIAQWIAQLSAADAATRAEAAERLCRAGLDAVPAAVPLVKACGDAHDEARDWAVAALEELGSPPPEAIGELTALVASGHPLVAYWATTLLGRSGQAAAAATAALAAALDAGADPAVAERAAWALGKVGPRAASARPALERAASAPNPRLARLAQEALAAIGP